MILQYRKHCSSFLFLLRVSPKRYIFLPIIIYFGRKIKETGVTFYYLIYFPLKFDLFIVFIILFMKVEDTPFLEGHSTAMQKQHPQEGDLVALQRKVEILKRIGKEEVDAQYACYREQHAVEIAFCIARNNEHTQRIEHCNVQGRVRCHVIKEKASDRCKRKDRNGEQGIFSVYAHKLSARKDYPLVPFLSIGQGFCLFFHCACSFC